MTIKRLLTGAIKIITLSFISLTFVNNAFATETITTSVGVKPSLTLTMPTTTLNLSLDPSSTTFGYKDLPISVGTNNETGYKLTISTNNDDTNLVNTADSKTVIETLPPSSPTTAGYTDSDFVANKWGYKNGLSNNYFPFNSGDIVLENTGPVNDDNTTLRFATKIDYMQPEGTYSTTFNFSLVANPLTPTIQNIAPTRCTSTPLTVLDIRDNQEYIIQRLADGNCWMMTNLNLGAVPLVTDLTSANSNFSGMISASDVATWKKTTAIGNGLTPELVSVAGIDSTSQTSYGVLYNYCAATAMTTFYCENGRITGDSTEDLCPAGWRLPSANDGTNLYAQSEYNTVAELVAPISSGGFAFALAGQLFQSVSGTGTYGQFWESDMVDNTAVDTFQVSRPNTVRPYARTYPYMGYSVRCILKQP